MADWTVSWRPQLPDRIAGGWNTLVSTFETGEEQRRSKRTTRQALFNVQMMNLSNVTAEAIRTFYDARYGAYDTFNYPSYTETIKGTRLAIVEGGGSADTITDSSSAFVLKGFDASHDIWVAGSGAGNDAIYGVGTVVAGTVTLDVGEDVAAESANTDLEVFKSYTVRFVQDSFELTYITATVCAVSCQLIEVL